MQRGEGFGSYSQIHERAVPFLDTRDNEIHAEVSFRFALRLLAAHPDADDHIVLPAIILHDIGWKSIPEELHLSAHGPTMTRPDLQRLHEVEGARLADQILATLDYPPADRAEIVEIIDGHDTRLAALSLNDRIVKDADKLWRYSVPGSTLASHRFGIPWHDYLESLEQHIDEWMFTEEGRKLAHEALERTRQEGKSVVHGKDSP